MRRILLISLLLIHLIVLIFNLRMVTEGVNDISSTLDLSSATSAYIRAEANEERQEISAELCLRI